MVVNAEAEAEYRAKKRKARRAIQILKDSGNSERADLVDGVFKTLREQEHSW